VTIREFLMENFAGDLEYHPRRAMLYLSLGIAAACFWKFSPHEARFTAIPLIFVLGSLTLFVKGIFLFRRSSEGLGLSHQELTDLSSPSRRKNLPSITAQAAKVVQDFGTGAFFALAFAQRRQRYRPFLGNPPRFSVFLSGAALFFLGWLIRRFTSPPSV
jgi:hypothetical protein